MELEMGRLFWGMQWAHGNHKGFLSERGKQESQCQSDVTWERLVQSLLALKVEEDMSQGMPAASRSCQWQGNGSSQKGTWPC